MHRCFLAAAITIHMTLLGQETETLDDLMPIVVQNRAGLQKLTPQEKTALAAWLVQFREESVRGYQKQTEKPPKKALSLSENLHNGKILKLTDGSVWEVAPQDVETSAGWLLPFDAEIAPSGNTNYPYTILNKSTKTKVFVRRLDSAT